MRKFVDENRPQLGWLVAFLLVVGIGLTAATVDPDADPGAVQLLAVADNTVTVPRSDVEAVIAELESWLAVTTTTQATTTSQATTSTSRPTTTTTIRPTTTTTIRPTTTTTIRPTTTTATTQPPTTTTTGPPGPSGDRYDFFVNVSGIGTTWTAPYFRSLPYTPDTGWADGNRDGYKCAYGILLWNDDPAGRVTFTRVAGAAAYTIINDRYMPENGPTNRHYNTGLTTPQPVRQGECPPPTEAYEPNFQPGHLPVIDYLGPDGELLERRDYRTIVPTESLENGRLKFRLTSVNELQVTVVAYWDDNPYVAIYYQAPFGGGVTMDGYIP